VKSMTHVKGGASYESLGTSSIQGEVVPVHICLHA
jgi:hypothetical protein